MKTLRVVLPLILYIIGAKAISQELLSEVSMEDQISNSSQIIEGRVLSKQSYWNENQTNIFTINWVEVYKVFKGQPLEFVEIITPGGTVGLQAEIITPALDLFVGDEGVFMLQEYNQPLQRSTAENISFLTYSDTQGFYKYNYNTNSAVRPFQINEGIQTKFYNAIVAQTNQSPISLKNIDLIAEKIELENTTNRSPSVVTGISPTVATAGTGTVLTITGVFFSPNGTVGTVSFPDANDGGATFFQALDSQVLSWTDTEVRVEVPSRAGSGPVRLNTAIGPQFSEAITIDYAQLNVSSSATGTLTAYQTQHFDQNGLGGMTFQMHTEFMNNNPARLSFMRSFDTWVCETGINWIIGSPTIVDVAQFDNINIIRFDNGSELPAGVLGRTSSYWNGCSQGPDINWFVAELDIVYNDGINWNFGPGAPVGNQIDFESVSVHELGHAHQLGHVIDNSKIMFWSAGPGSANRTLSDEDIAGANDVQSRSTSNPVCGLEVMTNTSSSCFLSVSDEFMAESIYLFPNPTKDVLNITLRGGIALNNIQIYDLSGKLVLKHTVKKEQLSNNIQLFVSNFSSGMYFVELNGGSTKTVKKLLIE